MIYRVFSNRQNTISTSMEVDKFSALQASGTALELLGNGAVGVSVLCIVLVSASGET